MKTMSIKKTRKRQTDDNMFYAIAVAPLMASVGTMALYGFPKPEPDVTKPLPPDFVFAVVWTLLYILIGIAMARSWDCMISRTLGIVLVVCLLAWTPLFTSKEEYAEYFAFYLLQFCFLLALALYTTVDQTSKLLLVPLLVWLLTASKFNYSEVLEGSGTPYSKK